MGLEISRPARADEPLQPSDRAIRRRRQLRAAGAVLCALTVSLFATAFLFAAEARADAAVSVSKSVTGKPLLGGQATCRITVTNTGDAKGYNLGLSDVFSSSRPDPEGRISIVSMSDGDGAAYPTAVSTSETTGDTTVALKNIRDLSPGESYTLTIVVSLAGDPRWEVDDLLTDTATATLSQFPDGGGATYTGSAGASARVVPVRLATKSVQQSTSVHQASGTQMRPYQYTLTTQNNFTAATDDVVLVDSLPDGVEFLGVVSGPGPDPGYPQRDPATGITTVRWTFGTLAASEAVTIRYDAGIRYDYYGTDNGGTNRPADDFSGTAPTGTPVPDKRTFINTCDLTADFQGTPAIDSANASVTGAYLTIGKGADVSTGGNGTEVTYTLTYSASEYYDILEHADPESIVVRDTLPNGMTYVAGSASPVPSSITANLDGTTDLVWGGDALDALDHGQNGSVVFRAVVDETWSGALSPLPIVAGDALTNSCSIAGWWQDLIDPDRANSTSDAASTTTFSTGKPGVQKDMQTPDIAVWTDSLAATVGDVLSVRVRFNTADGATPLRSDIRFGRITMTDWLPPGMSYNDDAVVSYSGAGDFAQPSDFPTINYASAPVPVAVGGLSGLDWYLGDVAKGGWWQAEFTVTVQDSAAVADGVVVSNLWKMTGIDTAGQQYSDRDAATIAYVEPHLVLTKSATTVPSPLLPGSTVRYTATIENTGLGAAQDVVVVDTVAAGMRAAAPAIVAVRLDGVPLSPNSDYKLVPAYDPANGVFTIDLHDTSAPAVDTPIPAGKTLTVVYECRVDGTAVAGGALTNIASVGYSTQAAGGGRPTPTNATVAADNTDDATVTVGPLAITKSVSPTTPITIGDTVTYTLRVTVPAGMRGYWPMLRDTVDRDGVTYVPGSATLTQVSGTPVSGAVFDPTYGSDPVAGGTTTTTTFTWFFSNPIDNGGQSTAYVFELRFRVLEDGLEDNGAWEFWLPTTTDRNRDSARIYWNTADVANRPTTPNASAVSGNVDTQVDQPLLRLSKTATSTPPYSGGSTVTYTSVISQDGSRAQWPAHDILWKDSLAAQLESPAIVSVTHSALGALTAGVGYVADLASRPITIDFSGGSTHTSLAPGATITIVYTARIVPGTGAGASITNTADVDWSTIDGTPVGSRRYTDTNQAATWTADSDNETIRVAPAALVKTCDPTSATIGDTVAYRLRVTVPAETRLLAPAITDAISTTGMVYVPGSASVSLVSGTPAAGAVLSGAVTETRLAGSSTLAFPLATPIDNADPTGPAGDADYVFDITYQVRVTGTSPADVWIWDPTSPPNGTADRATLAWNDGATARQASDDAALAIIQPWLKLTKTFDPHTLDAAGPVNTSVVVVNDGQSTAFENPEGYDFTDTAPPGFRPPTAITVTHSANGLLVEGVDYSVTLSGNDLALEYTSDKTDLEPAETLTITYTNALDPAAATPGRSFTNSAESIYASLPAGDDLRVYGTDPDPFTGDRARDSDTVVIAGAAVVKTTGAPGGQATIGQAYDYTVTLSIPRGTTVYRGAVSDVVPDGLTVLAASVSHGSVTFTTQTDGTTDIEWTLPTPWSQTEAPSPAIVPTMTIGVRVDDTYADGAPLNGLPPQDTLRNEATFEWWDEPSGGTPLSASDDELVTIVEPRLTIDKQVTPASAAAGDTVTFTAVVGNAGTSAAHDLAWQDDLPAALFDRPASPTLVSVVHSSLGPLTSPTSYSSDFAVDPITIDLDETTHPAAPVDLGPGETLTITYQAVVRGGVTGGQELTDTAAVTGASLAGSDDARDYGPVEDQATVTARAPRLSLSKTVTAGATVQRGGTVTFRLEVENSGDATALDVDLSDSLPSGPFTYVPGTTSATWPSGASSADPAGAPGPDLTWALGATLAPGETVVLTFDMAVGRADPDDYTNSAEATGDDGAGSPVDPDTDTAGFEVVKPTGGPSVGVDKHLAPGQPATVRVGETVTYEIVVTNTGPSSIERLPLRDTYPSAYLTYDSAVPSPDAAAAGQLDWSDLTGGGELAPGDDITVSVSFTATAPNRTDPAVNTASVSGAVDEYGDTAPDAADADSTLTVLPPITDPAVSVDKQLAPGQANPVVRGDEVTFRIVVTNVGDVPLVSVPLRDTFDGAYLEFVSADPAPNDASTAGVLLWDDLTGAGPLEPTESITVTVTFRAMLSATATTDTVLVSGAVDQWDQPAPDSSDSASVGIREPEAHVTVAKALASDQPSTVIVGDDVVFDIVVRNTGDTTLVTVPLRDTFEDADLEFVSADPAPNDTATAGRLEWDDLTGSGTLAPDATATVRVTFRALAATDSSVNTAVVAGAMDAGDREAPRVESSDEVSVVPLPASLTVTKSLAAGQESTVYIGEKVRFTIVVENTGRATLETVPLSDVYGSDLLTFIAADPAPDTSGAGTLAWTDLTGAGDLRPGDSVRVELTFKTLAESAAATDTVTVSGATTTDGRDVPEVSDDAGVRIVPRGKLRLVKTVRDVNGGKVLPGDELLWRIEVRNVGKVQVRQVVVTDTVPRHTAYVGGSVAGKGADDTRAPRLRWSLGTLKPGVTRTVSFRSRVRDDVPAGTRIRNTARVDGFEVDPITSQVGGEVSDRDSALARTAGGGYATVWASGGMALFGALFLGLWFRGKLLGTRVARDW